MKKDASKHSLRKDQSVLLDSFLRIRALLVRRVGSIARPQEIEDIVQETFVLSYAASLDHEIQHPKAFMMRVARNIALDSIRNSVGSQSGSLDELEEEILSHEFMPEREYLSHERFLAFCDAVAELPLACRRAFILQKVYGLSVREVSEHMHISLSTAEKHVGKGMSRVMQYMKARGYSVRAETRKVKRGPPEPPTEVHSLD
jgi:RNA polymerase sigma factor (sigma-70 family)